MGRVTFLRHHKPSGPLPNHLQSMVSANEARLGCFFGNIFYFDEVTSTNDLALEWAANGATEGTVIVARAQTAGRGRQGRRWVSPADVGLYVSLILRPCRVVPLLTHTVGVALAESLRALTDLQIETSCFRVSKGWRYFDRICRTFWIVPICCSRFWNKFGSLQFTH